jgi:hypothetical protein
MPASNFIGRINNYKFTSENSNQFSSFEEQFYSPNSTLLTFEGIDDGKLPKNNELIVNWNNEDNSPVSLNSIVIISGSNIDGSEPQLIYKIPSPGSTSVSFTASELSQLNNFERISVYYAKGYEHIEMINNKSIAFQFINFSNSTIYFKQ